MFQAIQMFHVKELTTWTNWIKLKDKIISHFFDLTWGHCLNVDIGKVAEHGLVHVNVPWGKANLHLFVKMKNDPRYSFKFFAHMGDHLYHINDYSPR